jgi:hypothetical protein
VSAPAPMLSSESATPGTGGGWRRLLLGPEGRKFFAGIVLIAAVVWGQQLYGMVTAASRLDPALRNPVGPSNVIVVLDFMPDRFHSERIREYGAFAGRDGTLNRIRLRNVSPENLRRLANVPWVARIEPMK